MKKETYEKACELKGRIKHVDMIISAIGERAISYKLEPPERMSGFDLTFNSDVVVSLSEAEALCILDALVDEKARLHDEFDRL